MSYVRAAKFSAWIIGNMHQLTHSKQYAAAYHFKLSLLLICKAVHQSSANSSFGHVGDKRLPCAVSSGEHCLRIHLGGPLSI